jgi:hypothetical protein
MRLRSFFFEASLDDEFGKLRDDFPGNLSHDFFGKQFDGAVRDGVNRFGRQLFESDLSANECRTRRRG